MNQVLNNNKKTYKRPVVKVVEVENQEIIAASGYVDPWEQG